MERRRKGQIGPMVLTGLRFELDGEPDWILREVERSIRELEKTFPQDGRGVRLHARVTIRHAKADSLDRSLSGKKGRHADVLAWALARCRRLDRFGRVTAAQLAAQLTVENAPDALVPAQLLPDLTRFRKLRTVDRERVAARFLQEVRDARGGDHAVV